MSVDEIRTKAVASWRAAEVWVSANPGLAMACFIAALIIVSLF